MIKISDLRVSDHIGVLFEICMSVFSLLLLVELLGFFGVPVVSIQYVRVVISRFHLGYSLRWGLLLFAGVSLALFYKTQGKTMQKPVIASVLGGFFFQVFPFWVGLAYSVLLFFYIIFSYSPRVNLLNRFFLTLCALELFSLVHWASQFIFPNSLFQSIALVEDQLYGFAAIFAPAFSLVFLLLGLLPITLKDTKGSFLQSPRKWGLPVSPRKLFIASVLFAVLLPLIPYNQMTNPGLNPTSPDVHLLAGWVEESSVDISSIFTISEGSRIGFILSTLLFKSLLELDSYKAVLFFPSVIFPLFVASVYYLTVQGTRDRGIGALSAFFTVFGFVLTEGMFVYFISNIQFLTLFTTSLGVMFDYQRTGSRKSLVVSTLLFVVAMFFHPWAFSQMYLSMCMYLLIEARPAIKTRVATPALKGLAVFVLFSGSANLVYSRFLGYGGIASLSSQVIQFKPWLFIPEHIQAVNLVYHGALSNSLIFLVSIAGVLLMDRKDSFSKAMIAILVTVSLGYGFFDSYTKNRVLINVFYGVFSGYAASSLLSNSQYSFFKSFFYFYAVSVMVYTFKLLFFFI